MFPRGSMMRSEVRPAESISMMNCGKKTKTTESILPSFQAERQLVLLRNTSEELRLA